jgi:hypothetical protein
MTPCATFPSKLAEWRPAPGQRATLVHDDPSGWTIQVEADRNDEMGCLVWELTLRRAAETAPPPGALTARATDLARRLVSLPDRLVVHEIDEARGEALLRSAEIAPRPDRGVYHEVVLCGLHVARLRRFEIPTATPHQRRQAALPLTHETLVRLATELAG